MFVFTNVTFSVHTLDEHQTVVHNICEKIHACTYIHAYKYTYIYVCDYFSTGEFEYLLCWRWESDVI
jgi:hypothetical protein